MSVTSSTIKIIQEGKAKLRVPNTVFYNPIQEFNRDLSVLVLRTYLKHNVWHHKSEERFVKERGGMKILDALSASGLRSIRYAKELGQCGDIVDKIVANDISDAAVELIDRNIELNEVSGKVVSSKSDAAMLLYRASASFDTKFHVIDLDPFGTGSQFFDSAIRGIGDAGLLMVTCTDAAVLCGNASESCFARYGSMSLRSEFCHEGALRIILKSLESHASVCGKYIKPLLSLSIDFYVRLFVQVFTKQVETKKSASKLSQIYLCRECETFELNPLGTVLLKEDPKQAESKNDTVKYKYKPAEVRVGNKCTICEGGYNLGGPIWSNPMHDKEFLGLLKQELSLPETREDFATFRRIQGMVYMCSEELENPLFYSVDTMASGLKMKMPRMRDILSALMNAGFKVSCTHTNKNGFKTDAPSKVVWDIFCQASERQKHPTEDPLANRILSRQCDKEYDFTYNPDVEAESQKLNFLRFQMNPTREWGPKTRPAAQTSPDKDSKQANLEPIQGDDSQKNDPDKIDQVCAKRRKILACNPDKAD